MKILFSKIFKMTHMTDKKFNEEKLRKKNCKKRRRRILEINERKYFNHLNDSRKILDCRSIALISI